MMLQRKGLWMVILGMALVIGLAPVPVKAIAPVDRFYRIEASRFAYHPAVLSANPGDRVTIELVSTDVVHGLSVDGYNLSVSADPGQSARLSFVVDRQGAFRFRCTVTCGNMHPFMLGKLQVGHNLLLWRAIALSGLVLLVGIWGFWK